MNAMQEDSDGENVWQKVLVSVSWLKRRHATDHIRKPVELWSKDLFDDDMDSFIPVQLLIKFCHSVSCEVKHEGQTVVVIVSVQNITHRL